MLNVNDKIRVHMYGTDRKEIQTRNVDAVYTVREENGKLGIDYNTEKKMATNNVNAFVPFEAFSFRALFENVETGKKYYWSNVNNGIIGMED